MMGMGEKPRNIYKNKGKIPRLVALPSPRLIFVNSSGPFPISRPFILLSSFLLSFIGHVSLLVPLFAPLQTFFRLYLYNPTVTRKLYFYPRTGFYFRTCEEGAGWHMIPYRISPRSESFSQAYKNWHITWGINLGPDWPPLARGSKFHTIHTPTRPLSFLPLDNGRYEPIGFSRNNIIL